MSIQSSLTKTAALGASAGILFVPFAMSGLSANATTLACADQATGAIEVGTGVCQMSYGTAGTFTFTAPSGISKLSAVIIGAGGGGAHYGQNAYGGGGGTVSFVDTVNISTAVTVEVGLGGAAAATIASADNGGSSSVNTDVAAGGGGATIDNGGTSGGSGTNAGLSGYNGASGSSGMAAGLAANGASDPVTLDGGPGITFADVVGSSPLFDLPSDTTVFAPGGAISVLGSTPAVMMMTPGAGGAGRGDITEISLDGSADAGQDGAVYLRWAGVEEPTLATTGSNSAALIVTGGLLFVAGAGALLTRRRGVRH